MGPHDTPMMNDPTSLYDLSAKCTSTVCFKLVKRPMGLEPYAITDEDNPTG